MSRSICRLYARILVGTLIALVLTLVFAACFGPRPPLEVERDTPTTYPPPTLDSAEKIVHLPPALDSTDTVAQPPRPVPDTPERYPLREVGSTERDAQSSHVQNTTESNQGVYAGVSYTATTGSLKTNFTGLFGIAELNLTDFSNWAILVGYGNTNVLAGERTDYQTHVISPNLLNVGFQMRGEWNASHSVFGVPIHWGPYGRCEVSQMGWRTKFKSDTLGPRADTIDVTLENIALGFRAVYSFNTPTKVDEVHAIGAFLGFSKRIVECDRWGEFAPLGLWEANRTSMSAIEFGVSWWLKAGRLNVKRTLLNVRELSKWSFDLEVMAKIW